MKDKSIKDKSMKDESRENYSDGPAMKDKSRQRSSRKSRASSVRKMSTEETAESSKPPAVEAGASASDDKIDKDSRGKDAGDTPTEKLPSVTNDEEPRDSILATDAGEHALGNSQGSAGRRRRKSNS